MHKNRRRHGMARVISHSDDAEVDVEERGTGEGEKEEREKECFEKNTRKS